MRFPKTIINTEIEIPQDFELFANLFAPLGLFAFAFVKLERTLSWSYTVAEADCSELDVSILLYKTAEFEGSNKSASQRILKWFNTLQGKSDSNTWLADLNKLRSGIENLNNHRNRLIHDSSGAVSQSFGSAGFSEPEFHFTQQMKSGEIRTRRYSKSTLNQLVDDSLSFKAETRRLTTAVIPDAPNIEV